MSEKITFEQIKKNEEINTYIRCGNEALGALGFTEHSFPHALRSANFAANILRDLDYDNRTCELAEIAGYMHDIGNCVNRTDHAHSGALMAFTLLNKLGMDAYEIAIIVSAIGNHDEGTANPVNAVSAALILSDKSDVRRARVRNREEIAFDIHDRVNFACEKSSLEIDKEKKAITLELKIDTTICPVMEYFEIFLTRMILCRRAAAFLGLTFELVINEQRLL